jgi:hypothetical protein
MSDMKETPADKAGIENIFRLLWMRKTSLIRMYVVSIEANLPEFSAVSKRIFSVPADFSCEFKKYFDSEKVKLFEELLTQHITIFGQLVYAIVSGNKAKANDARRKWYENADETAECLADINFYYCQSEWRVMLYDHLFMIENAAAHRIKKNYDMDIEEYDRIESQALRMAEMMSEGIIQRLKL